MESSKSAVESSERGPASKPGRSRPSLFITGATGYVGRRLLQRLERTRYVRVACLVRDPSAPALHGASASGFDLVGGDLGTPAAYLDALRGCDTVVHLAAVTGKAKPTDYFRVNREGTRALVDAAKAAGVRQLLHVSTIAVKYRDEQRYFYAHSKREAEQIVARSGVAFTILRPTIVTGPGSPVAEGLARMAGGWLMPVFGDGTTPVQPIFVDDLIDSIMSILSEGRFRGEIIELGGPEVMTIEELMSSIGRARFGRASRPLHLPLGAVRTSLSLLEPLLLPVLPLTSGQLALFANDGTVEPSSFVDERKTRMKGLDAVLRLPSPPPSALDRVAELQRECDLFHRFLTGDVPSDYLKEQYVRYHERPDARTNVPGNRFDGVLLSLSRLSPAATRLVDAYTSVFRRRSIVRKKLVLMVALLECDPSAFRRIDSATGGSGAWIWAKLWARASSHALCLLIATPPLAALGLAMRWLGPVRVRDE